MIQRSDILYEPDAVPFEHPWWCVNSDAEHPDAVVREKDDSHGDELYTADALGHDNAYVSLQLVQRFETWPVRDPATVLNHDPGVELVVRSREVEAQASVLFTIPEARRILAVLTRVLQPVSRD